MHIYVIYVCFSKADTLSYCPYVSERKSRKLTSLVQYRYVLRTFCKYPSSIDRAHIILSLVIVCAIEGFLHRYRMRVSYSEGGMNVAAFSRFCILLRLRRQSGPSSRPPCRPSPNAVEEGDRRGVKRKRIVQRTPIKRLRSAQSTRISGPAITYPTYVYVNRNTFWQIHIVHTFAVDGVCVHYAPYGRQASRPVPPGQGDFCRLALLKARPLSAPENSNTWHMKGKGRRECITRDRGYTHDYRS